ncbi:protein ROS1A [Lycium barbarum]|uniref:protein ROS1A n=1 Tax=Lycium barbarum TaxID=112863 RepID=UPI00293E092E|nr:protein ROS1A [Lycium barbarum]XP_060201307.1 protein ROS1A [Lycium barbarum]XP_060201308.1 protein ROS1A [Lycium barbarum]
MEGRRGSLFPEPDDFQIGTSWFPATSAKPSLPPIWENRQQNQPAQVNGVELQKFSQGEGVSQANQLELRNFFQEPQGRQVAACCGSTNLSAGTAYFDTWEEAAVGGTKSEMYGDNNIKMCNNLSIDDVDQWSNVCSFGDLLALAHAAGSTAATENANADTNFTANGSFYSLVGSQDAEGSSICSRFPFNLNSPTRMTDEGLSINNGFQFEPITPDQIKNKGLASDAPSLDINQTPIARHVQSSEDTLKRAEASDPQANKEQSGLVLNISELQENKMLAKADELDAEQNNTPQQKRRRKKHRPKVVIEGEHKRTPKPKTPQQHSSQEAKKERRKYVRRNKVEGPPSTPSDKVNVMTSHEGHRPSSGEIRRAKRTYVRGNQVNKLRPNPAEEGTIDPPNVSRPRRTCRKSLNFDSENSSHWPSSSVEDLHENQSNSSVHPGKGIEATTAKTELGSVDDITCSNQELKTCQTHHEMPYPDPSTLKIDLNHGKFTMSNQNEISRGKCKIVFSDETHDKQAGILEMTPKSPNSSNCSSSACLIQETPERALKRRRSFRTDEAEFYRTNVRGAYFNSMQAYQAILPANEPYAHSTQGMHFPAIYKKKRTEKSHPSGTSYTKPFTCEINYLSLSQCNTGLSQASTSVNDKANNGMQNLELVPAFVEAEGLRRKRSKSISKVRDLASLLEICRHFPTTVKEAMVSEFGERYENSDQPNTCMEALVADTRAIMKTKKRSKRSILVSSTASHTHARQQFRTNASGSIPAITWRSPVDEIAERLQHLDLNRESIHQYQYEQNALVIYQRDGSIVPFSGSFVRKRRPRPKVDLDDETTRVWKLLLQDINSEGIDGTDEDKAKWWESERGVFHGRVDSFVSRMRLVQGDRRFSPWKGSVVDSVVGVFLTQNVSDHLSSSAFMSMAARFPLKSNTGFKNPEERTGIIIEEPEVSAPDPDDTIGWHDDQPTLGQEFFKISGADSDDEKTAVHSSESSENSINCTSSTENSVLQQPGSSRESSCVHHESTTYGSATANATRSSLGDQIEPDDLLSSQNSVLSSQDSVNFSVVQTSERTESSNFSGSTSFLKLLHMAGTSKSHGVQDQKSENILAEKDIHGQLKHMACCSHFQKDEENHRGSIENDCPCSYLGSCAMSNAEAQQIKCKDDLEEAAKLLDLSRELGAPEQSKLSAEPANQALYGEMRETYISRNNHQSKVDTATIDDPVVNLELQIQIEESNYNMQPIARAPAFSEAIVDVQEEVSVVVDSSKSAHTASRLNSNNNKNHAGSTLDRANHNTRAKKERPGKEKQNVDWDSLRLQAQSNGKKRERTANTMDSLDWDAVRCADVNEIANTIRERGMNNMLAERIKDFLNRIFREHGSIDLEWLRDVPPDKAKEYLLSIRGLGLKSVECVRLLTLHNLAFPVDTNVGRIAVRLGWVPLQPLPESLQLHLLELYPVLESIQKYLWPRLCKLDQRTLYELHYHMITFGKVFCTKSKPNCNACPMRGECRHFASAFASARLALPAPEEKGIVSTTENKAAEQSPFQNFGRQPLPLPPANQIPLEHPKLINSAPIIEVPATPEPIVEEPATPEPEQEAPEIDIEDAYCEDPNEIPTIELNMAQFAQNVKNFVRNNMELQEVEMSKALVALTPQAASIPTPKLKHISRLRTEHQVYELPDAHPLLEGFEKREPDDPCSYLLAIWTPGETADSIQPPGGQCNSQDTGRLCDDETCFACNSIREAHAQTVRGTILIPCRTAMRGSFPLNGTYFQVNEVFADHDSSLKPIDVPRDWLWNLPRRTVYFGTSIPTIFKGLTTESIQHCFWRGFVCVRGFDKETRAPRPLMARLHFPASKLNRTKGKPDEN